MLRFIFSFLLFFTQICHAQVDSQNPISLWHQTIATLGSVEHQILAPTPFEQWVKNETNLNQALPLGRLKKIIDKYHLGAQDIFHIAKIEQFDVFINFAPASSPIYCIIHQPDQGLIVINVKAPQAAELFNVQQTPLFFKSYQHYQKNHQVPITSQIKANSPQALSIILRQFLLLHELHHLKSASTFEHQLDYQHLLTLEHQTASDIYAFWFLFTKQHVPLAQLEFLSYYLYHTLSASLTLTDLPLSYLNLSPDQLSKNPAFYSLLDTYSVAPSRLMQSIEAQLRFKTHQLLLKKLLGQPAIKLKPPVNVFEIFHITH